MDVLAAEIQEHEEYDPEGCGNAAQGFLAALMDAGYVVVPREALALILSRYLQGDTSRDAASDEALHLLYADLDAAPRGSK